MKYGSQRVRLRLRAGTIAAGVLGVLYGTYATPLAVNALMFGIGFLGSGLMGMRVPAQPFREADRRWGIAIAAPYAVWVGGSAITVALFRLLTGG